jgi:hypothetical protein
VEVHVGLNARIEVARRNRRRKSIHGAVQIADRRGIDTVAFNGEARCVWFEERS